MDKIVIQSIPELPEPLTWFLFCVATLVFFSERISNAWNTVTRRRLLFEREKAYFEIIKLRSEIEVLRKTNELPEAELPEVDWPSNDECKGSPPVHSFYFAWGVLSSGVFITIPSMWLIGISRFLLNGIAEWSSKGEMLKTWQFSDGGVRLISDAESELFTSLLPHLWFFSAWLILVIAIGLMLRLAWRKTAVRYQPWYVYFSGGSLVVIIITLLFYV